jgi:hypothetical protein
MKRDRRLSPRRTQPPANGFDPSGVDPWNSAGVGVSQPGACRLICGSRHTRKGQANVREASGEAWPTNLEGSGSQSTLTSLRRPGPLPEGEGGYGMAKIRPV